MPQYDHGGPARIIDLQVRTGPWGDRYGEVPAGLTLEKIKAQPHGVDMGPMVPRADEMVCTPDGLVDLAPDYILGDLPRLRARIAESGTPSTNSGFRLVSRRHLRSKNSWLHNVKVLVKGKDRCTLLVHPDDAVGAGLVDGGRARVSSEAGTIEVPVEVTDEMMPGVVSLPHGWGHDTPGTRMAVAREHAGVNNNLLAPMHFYDSLSNNHAVNGIPVEVVPA
jgi:anaerobic selenocysteine-containing dehydrogenase